MWGILPAIKKQDKQDWKSAEVLDFVLSRPLCAERKGNQIKAFIVVRVVEVLWPSAYQQEWPAPDKDNSLSDLTPALAGPLLRPATCKYPSLWTTICKLYDYRV